MAHPPSNHDEDNQDVDRYAEYDDAYADEQPFQPLKKQSGKPQTIKSDRRQQSKEFGRAIHKRFKAEGKRQKP